MHRTHQKLWITPSRWTDYGVALGEGHLRQVLQSYARYYVIKCVQAVFEMLTTVLSGLCVPKIKTRQYWW